MIKKETMNQTTENNKKKEEKVEITNTEDKTLLEKLQLRLEKIKKIIKP